MQFVELPVCSTKLQTLRKEQSFQGADFYTKFH